MRKGLKNKLNNMHAQIQRKIYTLQKMYQFTVFAFFIVLLTKNVKSVDVFRRGSGELRRKMYNSFTKKRLRTSSKKTRSALFSPLLDDIANI